MGSLFFTLLYYQMGSIVRRSCVEGGLISVIVPWRMGRMVPISGGVLRSASVSRTGVTLKVGQPSSTPHHGVPSYLISAVDKSSPLSLAVQVNALTFFSLCTHILSN